LFSHTSLIALTATPIPRTLANVCLWILDCSIIDELPPWPNPVNTTLSIGSIADKEVIDRVKSGCEKQASVLGLYTD